MPEKKTEFYRIGDYAHFMGVSSDLLKHYERCGLLHARTAENGYRYYPFHESTRLLECMRLRSYGFSLHEIQTVLCDLPYEDVQTALDQRIDEMEKQILFQQKLIAEHRKISAWLEMMRENEQMISVAHAEAFLFLPQSRHFSFIQDDRITDILEPWVAAMPIVKSCRLFRNIRNDNPVEDSMWGLAVSESDAAVLSLPLNDAVIRIAGGKQLQLHLHHTLQHKAANPYLPNVLHSLLTNPLPIQGPVLQVNLMTLSNCDMRHVNCCYFAAPLEEASAPLSP